MTSRREKIFALLKESSGCSSSSETSNNVGTVMRSNSSPDSTPGPSKIPLAISSVSCTEEKQSVEFSQNKEIVSVHSQDSPKIAIQSPQLRVSQTEVEENLPETSSALIPSQVEEGIIQLPLTSSASNPPDSRLRSAQRYVISSSEESDPYEDSGDSYVPSSEESDNHLTTEDDLSDNISDSNDDANNDVMPNISQDKWRPCTNLQAPFQFSAQPRILLNNADLTNPYDIYRHFISEEILDIIVQETNRFATQYIQNHQLRPRSLMKKWKETNKNEMKNLFAILMIMGVSHLPKMRLYWSSTERYGSSLIQKTMKRDMSIKVYTFFQ